MQDKTFRVEQQATQYFRFLFWIDMQKDLLILKTQFYQFRTKIKDKCCLSTPVQK